MNFKQFNLPFGARLMYVKNKINKTTNVEISFMGGSSEEKIPGLAHFTEHMFFSGTDKLSAQEVKKQYFNFSVANAYTNFREIIFFGRIFTNELEKYLSTVAMMITETTFSPKAIENEKKIVIQEINASKDDNRVNFYDTDLSKIFDRDLVKKNVIGNEKSVKSIKRKDVLDFVKKYFVANNVDIYICTPLSAGKVKKIVINELLSKLKVADNFKKPKLFYFNTTDFNFYQSIYKDIGKMYLSIDFKVNHNVYDLDFYLKEKLIKYMINDISYGLMKTLRQDKSLVYFADYNLTYQENASFVQLITETDKNNANQIIEAVAEYISDLNEKGFLKEQFQKAKRIIRYSHESRTFTPIDFLDKLYEYRKYGKILDSEEVYKTIMNTTLEECNALINDIFDTTNLGCTLYGDVKKKDIMTEKKFFELFKVKNRTFEK